jgi:hypothetical protein
MTNAINQNLFLRAVSPCPAVPYGRTDASPSRVTDGLRTLSQAAARLLSASGTCGKEFPVVVPVGVFSCRIHRASFHLKQTKTGAINFRSVHWIAPSLSAPLAEYGRSRPQKIGPPQRACSLARSSIGLQVTRLARPGAWRSFASSRDNPHPALGQFRQNSNHEYVNADY